MVSREGLNTNIPPELLILYQKIKIPQTDPNALKHEINQYKYFTNCDPPNPPKHLAGYLV